MRKVISRLSRSSALRRLVEMSGMHKAANFLLQCRPVVKELPGSGVVYRATSLESIPLGVEMLETGLTYDQKFLRQLGPIESFADLGCNVGYFSCLLAHLNPARRLKGLMIDANARVVEEARWHASANNLKEVHALHGIVGEPSPSGEAQFFVYSSNICSSSDPTIAEKSNLKGTWSETMVPCIAVEKAWRDRFGDTRCQLLKIDVEGSEMRFLRTEEQFLKIVDSILIEWHKWCVQLPDLETFLKNQGFTLTKVFDEDESMGTCFFSRLTPS